MISIITPFTKVHEKFLPDTYKSLLSQAYKDWEWILLANAGGEILNKMRGDKRIIATRTYDDKDVSHNRIGRLKKFACSKAKGDIVVELDADDILTPNALEEIYKVFSEYKSVVFVYSNSAHFKDKTWESEHYSDYYGWRWRGFSYNGYKLFEQIAWPPSAQMMRFIFWAPNHVRAWRAKDYWQLGGHDETLLNGDDHDLCCRFYIQYGAKGFHHIDKCLYLYRIHDGNHCMGEFNQEIQQQTEKNYLKYSRNLATRWTKDEGLELIDLGGRFNRWPEYRTMDLNEPADIICDLNRKWPLDDNSIGVLKASHIFEHLRDAIHSMNEAYRVLAPGGWLFIEVPSTDGRGAYQDPTHISFWNENSFWYYTDKNFARFIKPEMKCRFQESRIVTYFPTEFEKQNNIPIVQADLICLKEPYSQRPIGEVLI